MTTSTIHAPDTLGVRGDESPGFWASTVGACDRFDSSAPLWRVTVRARGDRRPVAQLTIERGGEMLSLDDVDAALAAQGWARAQSWEMGSDDGWVAWLSPVADATPEGVSL